MPGYQYTVWFRDELAAVDDQDREWPACFVVEASNAAEARAWGDHLARDFSHRRQSETFLQSEIEAVEAHGAPAQLPRISAGYEATDEELGW